jgi:predicted Zn-dependent peptidase
LVVVGDVDPKAAEALIKAQFANWEQPKEVGKDPDLGTPKR